MNNFRQNPRVTPEPVESQMPALGVPNNVPVIEPVNTTPAYLGRIQPYMSRLHGLSQALGVVRQAGLQMSYQSARMGRQRQEIKQNMEYSKGLVEAHKVAAENRDIYQFITQNGTISSRDNPYHRMGYQALLAQTLASQYRRELNQAQLEHPNTAPDELIGSIKQRYAELTGQFDPAIFNKFFIEPGMQVESDTNQIWLKNSQERFNEQVKAEAVKGLDNTFQAEWNQVAQGVKTIDQMGDNLITSFQGTLEIKAAAGIPYQPAAAAMVDQWVANISTLTDKEGNPLPLASKLKLMDRLKEIKYPDGNRLLLGGMATKFAKDRQAIIGTNLDEEKARLEVEALEREQRTAVKINEMGQDLRANALGPKAQYITPGVDPEKVSSAHGNMSSGVVTTADRANTQLEDEFRQFVMSGEHATPEIMREWGSAHENGLISDSVWNSMLSTNERRLQQEQDAQRSLNVPATPINNLIKTLVPKVNYSTARWAGYGSTKEAAVAIQQQIQNKYRTELTNRAAEFLEQNPNANPQQVENFINHVWYNSLQSKSAYDVDSIEQQRGSWSTIQRPSLRTTPVTPGGAPKPQTTPFRAKKKPLPSASSFSSRYPWATDSQQFATASQQYFQNKGPIYDYVKKLYERTGRKGSFALFKRKHSPTKILEFFREKKYPTFLKQGPNSNGQ